MQGETIRPGDSAKSALENVSHPTATGAAAKPDAQQVRFPAPPPVWTRYMNSRLKQFTPR